MGNSPSKPRTRLSRRILLAVSLLLNVTLIPILAWDLLAHHMMYEPSVTRAAELGFAAGYHRGHGNDVKQAMEDFPTRLTLKSASEDSLEVALWPAKNFVLQLHYGEGDRCGGRIVQQELSGALRAGE